MQVNVLIDTIDSVKRFVRTIYKYPFTAELSSDRYIVDAKSIMGIFSLDISKPITLTIDSEDDCVDEFVNEISSYVVE